jgi:hypothetical protein
VPLDVTSENLGKAAGEARIFADERVSELEYVHLPFLCIESVLIIMAMVTGAVGHLLGYP